MTNETKKEIAAFMRDMKAICESNPDSCEHCPLHGPTDRGCTISTVSIAFNVNRAIAAVEAYRKRKKPCAEVIDRAREIYMLEVEVEKNKYNGFNVPVAVYAESLAYDIERDKTTSDRQYTVRVRSAKRYVLESHRESDREDDGDED